MTRSGTFHEQSRTLATIGIAAVFAYLAYGSLKIRNVDFLARRPVPFLAEVILISLTITLLPSLMISRIRSAKWASAYAAVLPSATDLVVRCAALHVLAELAGLLSHAHENV